MGRQPDPANGPADPDPEPVSSCESAASSDSTSSPRPAASPAFQGKAAREELLAGFADGGTWDIRPPGPDLAAAVASAAGPQWRCKGASGEQLIGMLGRLAALESWAAAGKLGVIRALIRDDDPAFLGGSRHGDLPDVWDDSLTHEIALALAASVPSADKTMRAAWELGARLPEIGALLAAGVLDAPKARLVAEVFQDLSDESAGRAEHLIVAELTEPPAKTYTQVERIATAIALMIDPQLGERRRKAAEQHRSRVEMFRERAGTAALGGRDLPTDQTLSAFANVNARAARYKACAVFGKARMDQLRATAYLDLLNGVTAEDRIAHGLLTEQTPADDQAHDNSSPETVPPSPAGDPTGTQPVLQDLIFPLATLLGLADKPGEGHGLGSLDPGLCRTLAATAAASPHTTICITITDPDGIAIGHGCAKTGKPDSPHPGGPAPPSGGPAPSLVPLPARINLTLTADQLAELAAQSRTGWVLAPHGIPNAGATPRPLDDPEWCRPWVLTLPGGQECKVRLEPVPTYECDHRNESHAYQPNAMLRHLVQVRDYMCTFPTCSRHARDSDFEHAVPYDQGGRTCACNAGARSRKCHRVKQSPGWKVAQPRPGWHEWQTPRGRTYTQGPKRYPM